MTSRKILRKFQPIGGGRGVSSSSSHDVLEAVGGVTGQPGPLAAAAQVLTVRPLHVDASLLALAAARGLQAFLDHHTSTCQNGGGQTH